MVNRTSEAILLKDVSFSGCLWEVVLAEGEATSPGRCLPGKDRVRFLKLDAGKYCSEQAQDGTIEGVCGCDGGAPQPTSGPTDPGLVDGQPRWFRYQTITEHEVGYGGFYLFEVRSDDLEQDFSAPGPYGH